MNIKSGKRIIGQDFVKIDDEIFFSSANCNGLYKWKIGEDTPTFLFGFSDKGVQDTHLHGNCILVNGKIYFAPANANAVVTYDVARNVLKNIKTDFFPSRYSKYYDICAYGDRVFIIPNRCEGILDIDTNTDEVAYHDEWTKGLELKKDSKLPLIKQGAFIRNGKLFIPLTRYNSIVEIDIDTYNSKVIPVGTIEAGFTDAYYDELKDEVWLLHNGVPVIEKYSISDERCKTIRLKNDSGNEYPYIQMLKVGDSILLIPYQDREFIKVNIKDDSFRITKVLQENIKRNQWKAYYYSASKMSDNEFVALSAGEEIWEVYDDECNLLNQYACVDETFVQRVGNEGVIRESKRMTLEDFLCLI